MITEITKDNTEEQRAMAMTLTSIGYGVGICAGPLIGCKYGSMIHSSMMLNYM